LAGLRIAAAKLFYAVPSQFGADPRPATSVPFSSELFRNGSVLGCSQPLQVDSRLRLRRSVRSDAAALLTRTVPKRITALPCLYQSLPCFADASALLSYTQFCGAMPLLYCAIRHAVLCRCLALRLVALSALRYSGPY